MAEIIKNKPLSDLTKKELYQKCVDNKELANDFDKFKNQIEEYKEQLSVRANYIQKLQLQRDQLQANQPSEFVNPHEILQNYKAKLHKEKTDAEEFLKTKINKCEMIDNILESM